MSHAYSYPFKVHILNWPEMQSNWAATVTGIYHNNRKQSFGAANSSNHLIEQVTRADLNFVYFALFSVSAEKINKWRNWLEFCCYRQWFLFIIREIEVGLLDLFVFRDFYATNLPAWLFIIMVGWNQNLRCMTRMREWLIFCWKCWCRLVVL